MVHAHKIHELQSVNVGLGELGENGTGRTRNWANFDGFGRKRNWTNTELGENGIDGKHLVMTGEAGLSGLFEIE